MEITVGQILNANAVRDAIHVPIVPAVLEGEKYGWSAGEEVEFLVGERRKKKYKGKEYLFPVAVKCPSAYDRNPIGIVDPFIQYDYDNRPKDGDIVYIFIKPGIVKSVRHEYEIEGLDAKVDAGEAEKWLRNFAKRWGFIYEEMIENACDISNYEKYGESYIVAHGNYLHNKDELGDDYEMFWKTLEEFKGQEFDQEHRSKVGWSCTC